MTETDNLINLDTFLSDKNKHLLENILYETMPFFPSVICNLITNLTGDSTLFDIKGRLALKKPSKKYNRSHYPKYAYTGKPDGDYNTITTIGKQLIIATDEIIMNNGGIPRSRSHDILNRPRNHFYLVKDDTCPGLLGLFDWINSIDDYFDKEINKKNNKNAIISYDVNREESKKKYLNNSYKPCFNFFCQKNNKDVKSKKIEKYCNNLIYKRLIQKRKYGEDDIREVVRVNFSHIRCDNNNIDIGTALFVPGNENPVNATCVTDFEKYFTWKSTCKFILRLVQLNVISNDESGMECFFSFVCDKLTITKARPMIQIVKIHSINLFTGKKIKIVQKCQ